MFYPLDGPSKQTTISVTTSTVVEAKQGSTPHKERKVVTIQPLNGKIYVYFADEGIVPSPAAVAANGFIQFKNQKETYEASDSQSIYLLAVTSTTNVVVAERA